MGNVLVFWGFHSDIWSTLHPVAKTRGSMRGSVVGNGYLNFRDCMYKMIFCSCELHCQAGERKRYLVGQVVICTARSKSLLNVQDAMPFWCCLGLDLDGGRATALVTLGGHDHVVPGSELEVALLLPFVEVLAGVDGATDALDAADGPVLVEAGSALDRGLVVAPRLVDVVDTAVVLYRAKLGGSGRGVVGAVGLDDVVLNQGAGGPSVQRKVCCVLSVWRTYQW